MYRAVVFPDLISHTWRTIIFLIELHSQQACAILPQKHLDGAGLDSGCCYSRKMTSVIPKILFCLLLVSLCFWKSLLWTMKLKSHMEAVYFESNSKSERSTLADVGQVDWPLEYHGSLMKNMESLIQNDIFCGTLWSTAKGYTVWSWARYCLCSPPTALPIAPRWEWVCEWCLAMNPSSALSPLLLGLALDPPQITIIITLITLIVIPYCHF